MHARPPDGADGERFLPDERDRAGVLADLRTSHSAPCVPRMEKEKATVANGLKVQRGKSSEGNDAAG